MIFPLLSCQNHSHHRESNLFHELIHHHYLRHKLWNQSRPGNFIDVQSGMEPRSPWISCAGFALLTTNMSLAKLPEKRWLGKFSAEGNSSVTGMGYFYPCNSMLIKLVGMTPDGKRVPQGAGRNRKHWHQLVFKVIFLNIATIKSDDLNKSQGDGDPKQWPIRPFLSLVSMALGSAL